MVTPTNWVNELPKAAQDFLSDKRLEEVECIVADMPGIARGKHRKHKTRASAQARQETDSTPQAPKNTQQKQEHKQDRKQAVRRRHLNTRNKAISHKNPDIQI